jgi:ribosomal protein L9
MPKVTVNNETFLLKWPPKMDEKILFVSKKYIKTWRSKIVVDWEEAMKHMEFKDFPNIDINRIYARYYILKQRNNPLYKKRLKKRTEEKKQSDSRKKIHKLWKSLPLEDRLRHGYKPKKIWSKNQKNILFDLVKKYCINKRINWNKITKDKEALKLPEKYQKDFNKLRYYYYSTTSGEKLYEKKKLCNKAYLQKNRKKCMGYLKKREKMIRTCVLEFLLKKL